MIRGTDDLNYTREELLQVLKDADLCLREHKGIGLDYFMHDSEICGRCAASVARSRTIIRYIMQRGPQDAKRQGDR